MAELTVRAVPMADHGSYREDMLAVLRGWLELFSGPLGPVATAVVGAMPQDPGLAEAFRRGVMERRKADMEALLARGVARGEVRADVPVDLARELGPSLLWHRHLITGDPVTPRVRSSAARRSSTRNLVEWVAVIVGAVIVALLIKTFVVQAFRIPSESMVPTLEVGDRVLVNKLSYDAHDLNRGDVVVFDRGLPRGDAETERRASETMKAAEYVITVSLGKGKGRAHYDTCDFGHAYVNVNADYRS